MTPITKIAAMTLGGVAITVGSYVTIAALTGTPMNALAGMSAFVPPVEEPSPVENRELPSVEEAVAQDRRGSVQVYEAASTPLRAFVMESPFSGTEIQALEDRLQARIEELDRREEALATREAELARSFEHVEGMYAELEQLRTSILQERDGLESRAEEVAADAAAQAERERAWVESAAAIYAEGKATTSAAMLLEGKDARQVALILNELDGERRRDLMEAIHALDRTRFTEVETALRGL